jgi:hypothetical protein
LSERTRDALDGALPLEAVGRITVRGKQQAVEVFTASDARATAASPG